MYIVRKMYQKEGRTMDEDTRKLLSECNSGCKMAINSIDQIQEYIHEEKLDKLISEFRTKQEELEQQSTELLEKYQGEEKEPGVFAVAMSWFQTEVKMLINDDSTQVAKLLMNGCNMGIQSICKYQREYSGASAESKRLAEKIVALNEDFMKALEEFL